MPSIRPPHHRQVWQLSRYLLHKLATLIIISLAAIFASRTAIYGKEGEEPCRPNIVLILADDLGYADLGIHGCNDIPTPNIDALANGGVRCTNAYVSGPYCSPTRAGLLTGRYQQRFGHEFNPGPPSPQNAEFGLSLAEKTLADHLKSAGYATGMVGKWHLGSGAKFHPLERGFQEYYGFLGGNHSYIKAGGSILRGREPVDEKEYLTDALAREATAFIDRHRQAPFFLYLTFNAVHTPMEATSKYLDRFASIADEKRRTYAAMLSAMDDAIGAVQKKLAADKLDDNTLIFFVSDNGGPPVNSSSNGALRGHKTSTWEGGIRVPMFVQWKGHLPAGKVYDQPVIQLDFLPTALAAAGVEVPSAAKLDGVNLLPYLDGQQTGAPHENLYWRFGQQMALRSGDWKLVKAVGAMQPQLYNLADDLSEKNDLTANEPQRVQAMQAMWDQWNAQLAKPTWGDGGKPKAGAGKGKAKRAAARAGK